MSDNDDSDYRPPKSTRFKPGQSGNPKGRPKRSCNLETDFDAVLTKKTKLREGSKLNNVTAQKAMFLRLMAKSLAGDNKATTTIINTALKLYPPGKRQDSSTNVSISEEDQKNIDDYVRRKYPKLTGNSDES